jgi:hypothetical protein
MRYKHEIFTKIILKDGFIILLYNMSALYLSNGSSWFRPCVHRRQIVERQFCRHDVLSRFEWTCVHRQRHDKTVSQQLKKLWWPTILRQLFCRASRLSAVLLDGAVYTGDISVGRRTGMNTVRMTV